MYNPGRFGVQTKILTPVGPDLIESVSTDLFGDSINLQNKINNMDSNPTNVLNALTDAAADLATDSLTKAGIPAPIAQAAVGFAQAKLADLGSGSKGSGGDGGVFNVDQSKMGTYIQDSAKYQFQEPSEPVPIILKSNIKPNHYKTAWNNGGDPSNSNPDLHLSKFKLRLFGSTNSLTQSYATFGPITNIQLQLARRLNFAVDATTSSTSNLISYFNHVVEGLLAYYHYDSIINFASNPYNRNSGVNYLREGITFSELQNLQYLKSVLVTFPIPPRLIDLVWYMSQFYRSSEINSSALLKMVFFNSSYGAISSENYEDNNFSAGTNLLQATTNLVSMRNTASIIAKAFPEWTVTRLPGSMTTPLFDDQFNTLWSNSPEDVIVGTNVTTTPSSSTITGTVQYSSFVEEVDGLIYSLSSILHTASTETGDNKWLPGILIPRRQTIATASHWTNRLWFDSFNKVFRQSYGSTRAHGAAGYTHVNNSGAGTQIIPFKAEQILGVSCVTIQDTCESFLDFIFQYNDTNFSSMPNKDNNSRDVKYNSSKGNNKPRRRNKPKKNKQDKQDKPDSK